MQTAMVRQCGNGQKCSCWVWCGVIPEPLPWLQTPAAVGHYLPVLQHPRPMRERECCPGLQRIIFGGETLQVDKYSANGVSRSAEVTYVGEGSRTIENIREVRVRKQLGQQESMFIVLPGGRDVFLSITTRPQGVLNGIDRDCRRETSSSV